MRQPFLFAAVVKDNLRLRRCRRSSRAGAGVLGQFIKVLLQLLEKAGRKEDHGIAGIPSHQLNQFLVQFPVAFFGNRAGRRPFAVADEVESLERQELQLQHIWFFWIVDMAGQLSLIDQGRQVGTCIFVADDQDLAGMLAEELSDLKEADAQQRVEEDGQHGDQEQRAAVAQLIAHLAAKD